MSQKSKLLTKLQRNPPPKDFRWEELILVMDILGFDLDTSGGGSHGHFVYKEDQDKVIDIYRPHPSGILYSKQLKSIVCQLKSWGMLQ